jgi:hypothetical protein
MLIRSLHRFHLLRTRQIGSNGASLNDTARWYDDTNVGWRVVKAMGKYSCLAAVSGHDGENIFENENAIAAKCCHRGIPRSLSFIYMTPKAMTLRATGPEPEVQMCNRTLDKKDNRGYERSSRRASRHNRISPESYAPARKLKH